MKKTVQVQMVEPTLEKIEGLKEVLHTQNRSEIVKTSIDIAQMIIMTLQNQGKVIVEDRHGKKQEVLIPGISP